MRSAVFRAGVPLFRMGTAHLASRFENALWHPQKTQEALRKRMEQEFSRTAYRNALGTGPVPPQSWKDVEPFVRQQQEQEHNGLVAGRAIFYVRTSGSTAARKDIPYTTQLAWSFTHMFLLWAHDLVKNGPQLRQGRIFLAVSPGEHLDATARGVPVGLEDDRDYLSFPLNTLLGPFLVVPPISRKLEPEQYRQVMAAWLLCEPELEVMSVWSPSYLLVLLDIMQNQRAIMVRALNEGQLHGQQLPKVMRARMDLVRDGWESWREVWPHLKLISCWTQGDAAAAARRLHGMFPRVTLQGKGLLATECAITVPMMDNAMAAVPLVEDVVLEGLDAQGNIVPLWEWREGETFEVLVTTWGGLVRYRLGDLVTVNGRKGRTPCLRFVGRTGGVVDMVGEKMDPAWVRELLERLCPNAPGTAVLLATQHERYARYTLLLSQPGTMDGKHLDAELCANHRYAQARTLGQLDEATVVTRADAAAWLTQIRERAGMRWGDIKDQALLRLDEQASADLLLDA